jgi:NAD(P)-dependent dehydrogenase (short-subunit alcohol dehydrogenase family)
MTATGLLQDAVVLISGGTQGLGAGIARQAAAEGAAGIAVTGRSVEAGRKVAQGITDRGVPAIFLEADLADTKQASSTVARTIERFGRLDAVVNAAGLTTRGSMTDTTPELFDQHIAVNLKAPFFIMSETIRHLKERGAGGNIVNIISMSEHAGQPYLAPYVASKAGLAGLTRYAAHAHRWDKIRINGVNIGWTATEGEDLIQRQFHGAGDDWLERANASVPMGKLGQVDEIAEFVVFLLSARSGVVTGSVIDWDQNVIGAMD